MSDTPDVAAMRVEFEKWVRNWFGKGPQPGGFDQPAEFWLAQIEGGRYEVTRVDDIWTGWVAATLAERALESGAPLK